jgi:hypothetical protein
LNGPVVDGATEGRLDRGHQPVGVGLEAFMPQHQRVAAR